jgi:hypothetical protein
MLSPHNPSQNHLLADRRAADYARREHDLKSALRLLRLGHHVGWKVLCIVYSKDTIRHYEEIFGAPIREVFETTDPGTHRLSAYRVIESLTKLMRL